MTDPTSDPLVIAHADAAEGGAFFIAGPDGARIAEMTYARHPSHVVIDHTFVDDSLRGHGVARRLLDAAVAWARATRTPVRATCKYARGQFEKDPSLADVIDHS